MLNRPFSLHQRRVVVLGLGVSGLGAVKLILEKNAQIKVINKGPVNTWPAWETIGQMLAPGQCISQEQQEAVKQALLWAELIILSPGIARELPLLAVAHQAHIPVWSEIELAWRFNHRPITIAITGTNGKTTTTTLFSQILEASNFQVFTGGNIGLPFCHSALANAPKYDFNLLELSSFQLESIEQFSPHLAMILNITPSHGERYQRFEDYQRAKMQITRNMSAANFLLAPDYLQDVSWPTPLHAQTTWVNLEDVDSYRRILGQHFDLQQFSLLGNHNLLNLYFIFLAMEKLQLPLGAVNGVLANFRGVHHRLELVAQQNQLAFFNDAKSTNFHASLAALTSLVGHYPQIYWIMGGQKRGGGDDITPYLPQVAKLVTKIFLIGETTDELAAAIGATIAHQACYTLPAALAAAQSQLGQGAVVFSPAFPSFDQFRDYNHRGEVFIELVREKLSQDHH